MTTLARTAVLPFDHLASELVAFPLCSESALADPLTHLDPALTDGTGRLWRTAERELLASAPGISLDELIAMRDDYWFGGPDRIRPRPLHHHLAAAAQRHLGALGGGLGTRLPEQVRGPLSLSPAHAQARRAWMWLTFALPADLMLALCGAGAWVPEPDLLSPQVRELLSRGFAETHLHMGASFDFPTVWSVLTARLAVPGVARDAFAAPGACLGEGKHLAEWLLRAAIARWMLTGLLSTPEDVSFVAHLNGPLRRELCRRAGYGNFSLAVLALNDLATGRLSALPVRDLCGAYAALVGASGRDSEDDLCRLRLRDPIGVIMNRGRGSAEQRFVMGLSTRFDRREKAGEPDREAALLFWQTVRVRVMLYRYLTQRPLTPGLPWFIRFYKRMSLARGTVGNRVTLLAAEQTSGVAEGLTSLEVRTSPDPAVQALQAWVQELADTTTTGPERGLVFHFLKSRGGEISPGVTGIGGAGTHADPGAGINCGRCRYSHYSIDQRTNAEALAQLLHRWPLTQFVVRGLDACSDELAVPAWVIRSLLARVRVAAQLGARYLLTLGVVPPRPLYTTVHAGEDFAHLLTGLRNVHEAMDVLELREGDRIGHGLALGLDPQVWAARTGRAALPLEDRVFDLAWEWAWWTRRGGGSDAARLTYTAEEVADLAESWFGMAVDIRRISRLRHDLADAEMLAAAGFPDRERPRDLRRGSRQWLLDRFLRDADVFRRGMTTVLVDPTNEVEALSRIGISLREEIARRGLAIEINPTSNLLIGDLADLQNHPLWRLAPPRPRPDLPPLAITVGSDDPLVFNCRLPGEYQLLFDSLVLAGLTDAEAMTWLDGVRSNGLERRFTLPTRATVDGRIDLFDIEVSTELPPPW